MFSERKREEKKRAREREKRGNTAVQTHNHMTVSILYFYVPGVDVIQTDFFFLFFVPLDKL